MPFGSRYDAWLTTPPEYDEIPIPGDPEYPTCERGHFLPLNPDWVVTNTVLTECLGQGKGAAPLAQEMGWIPDCPKLRDHSIHKWTQPVSETEYRVCSRCLNVQRTTI
jgi:hypothetical protein